MDCTVPIVIREKPTRAFSLTATVMKVGVPSMILAKASVENDSRTSLATVSVIPVKAYVSRKTWVASTAKHKASASVASRSEISGSLVFTVVAKRRSRSLRPNVRAEAGPTAKRQARAVENARAHRAGLVF